MNAREIELILDVTAVAAGMTGIGRYAFELARRMPGSAGIATVRLTANGAWVEDLDARRSAESHFRMPTNGALQLLLRPAHALYRAALDARQLRLYEPFAGAVYHATNYSLPVLPGPTVVTICDLSVLRYPQFHTPARVRVIRRALERLRARAHALIAISEFTRSEVIDLLGWPPARVFTTPLGVGPEFMPRSPSETQPILARMGLEHGGYTLCVASIEPRKNVEGLIAAYAGLPPDLKRRYPLVLAGHRGWKSTATHERIERHAQEGWLRYAGYVPAADLPYLVAGAIGFIFPSLYEGFGLPVAEAMAAGVPVVTSDQSSLPEVSAGAALLVNPRDVDGLAEAIRRMLEDEAWRALARERGRTVAVRYTWHTTVARTIDIYREVAQGSESTAPALASGDIAAARGNAAPGAFD